MFISKRKFEESLANARMQGQKETEERIWQQERISRLEEDLHRRISALEDRIYKLEYPNGEKTENTIKPMR